HSPSEVAEAAAQGVDFAVFGRCSKRELLRTFVLRASMDCAELAAKRSRFWPSAASPWRTHRPACKQARQESPAYGCFSRMRSRRQWESYANRLPGNRR